MELHPQMKSPVQEEAVNYKSIGGIMKTSTKVGIVVLIMAVIIGCITLKPENRACSNIEGPSLLCEYLNNHPEELDTLLIITNYGMIARGVYEPDQAIAVIESLELFIATPTLTWRELNFILSEALQEVAPLMFVLSPHLANFNIDSPLYEADRMMLLSHLGRQKALLVAMATAREV
jgi:hypothetical protein